MLKVKMTLAFCLLISTLIFPASAFASTGTYSSYDQKQYSIIQYFLNFFGKSGSQDDDYQHFEDWYKKQYKDENPPKEDSYEIWKKWYCY